MEIKGIRETQTYLVEEVQKVYRDQGVSISDKHIELIVRQMTRRIGVQEPGEHCDDGNSFDGDGCRSHQYRPQSVSHHRFGARLAAITPMAPVTTLPVKRSTRLRSCWDFSIRAVQ